jgi:hypothetical protein
MIDVDGTEMSEEKLLQEAGHLVADACCLLFETQNEKSHAAAYMADSLLKYIYTIYKDENILSAAADYNSIEEKRYQEKLNLNEGI